jgi:hypothetical protein
MFKFSANVFSRTGPIGIGSMIGFVAVSLSLGDWGVGSVVVSGRVSIAQGACPFDPVEVGLVIGVVGARLGHVKPNLIVVLDGLNFCIGGRLKFVPT